MPYAHDTPPAETGSLEPIAICGQACHLPGSVRSPSSLWELLLRKGSTNTLQVPNSRFNIDAHFHRDGDRPGSLNVGGGYFLDGPAENFDPTFFNMTPVEAMWLDPQQRKILEVCYEAIESAGLTLDSISGTNTGVFVGSFTADYQQMTFRDPDFRHNYAATGVDTGIISNRVGNVFDLNGPSFTINTACSSSVYAIHQACHSLRERDCDAALVGGVNLVLTVDQHMNTAKLGVLSPTSFCHTFDASADGYGRGEGAGAMYLKRFSDAIRDGDIIRSVIRSSAVNTNGKVPGYGITFPNAKGQEKVIRAAYKRANMDPDRTAYFECHGTGTPVGDPIEVRAVSNAMNDTRSEDAPLIIGAVKPSIGHSEAASGIFAVMKASLMVENGMIPGVAGLQTINPQIPEKEMNVRVNRETIPWPEEFETRRASVSSFGYGGTNGHVIVEEVRALYPQYQHGQRRYVAEYDHSSTRPLLVTFSAHEKPTLVRNIEAHAAVVDEYYLTDFAHTINLHRTRFAQRAFAVASEPTASKDLATANFKFGSPSGKSSDRLAFIFTGQGAQWAGLGRDAIQQFPVFRETIRRLDRVLRRVEPTPNFSLEEELTAPAETSRVYQPDIAQPTLVATQIAIVDLLASWNIVPIATIGHSAGESAAAYAAGLASAPELITAAYYRGYSLGKYGPSGGSMLAVGKGAEEVEPYLAQLSSDIVIACENSPSSVTLSGPVEAIQQARDLFTEEKIFARELRTGMAYHSPQMNVVAGPMVEMLSKAWRNLDSYDKQWRCPRREMVSTVTGKLVATGEITPEYWGRNLTGRVLFSSGLATLVKTEGLENISTFVEVGPHSALSGPFKQICQTNGFSGFGYAPTLLRNQDGAVSLLKTAGELFLAGYPVDLDRVNNTEAPSTGFHLNLKASNKRPYRLVDLPTYQWNYDKVFWAEPRLSAEYRQLTHARHDLLGRRIVGLSTNAMVWRNILRVKDIPWLQNHKLGGTMMFPAAGHLALGIEAAHQHCEINQNGNMKGAIVRNVEIKAPLVIPDSDNGIEIQVRLSEKDSSSIHYAVESCVENVWTLHSEGTVALVFDPESVRAAANPINPHALTQRHPGKRWNDAFRRVGFEYGQSFDVLDKVRTDDKLYQASGKIPISTSSNRMIDESRYLMHPAAVDCLLQLCIVAVHAGRYNDMPWGVVPVKFDQVTIMPAGEDEGVLGDALAWNNVRGPRARNFKHEGQLFTPCGRLLVDIQGLHTVAYEAAVPMSAETNTKPAPYAGVVWKPDYTMTGLPQQQQLTDVVALLCHKEPVSSALLVDSDSTVPAADVLKAISPNANLDVVTVSNDETSAVSNVNLVPTSEWPLDLSSLNAGKQELILLGASDIQRLRDSGSLGSVANLLNDTGKAICVVNSDDVSDAEKQIEEAELSVTDRFSSDKTIFVVSRQNERSPVPAQETPAATTLVYSKQHSAPPLALADALHKAHVEVEIKTLEDVNTDVHKNIILFNPLANLLSQPDSSVFETFKSMMTSASSILWLTSGVNQGKSTHAGMVPGFLRVLRQEQKMSTLTWLDVDQSETFESIAHAMASVTSSVASGTVTEHEYWLHKGVCHISRIVPNEELNERMVPDQSKLLETTLPRGRLLQATFDHGHVTFKDSYALEGTALQANEVDIQVENNEFHKRDANSTAAGPRLVSGTVLEIGSAVNQSLIGKTVVAFVSNPYDTIARVPEQLCTVCDATISTSLVSLSDACRAVNALYNVPGSLEQKHVVLLSSSKDLSTAVSQLGKIMHFQLTEATTATAALEAVKAAGSSAVVLAENLSSEAQSIWRDLPSGAWLVVENGQGALAAPTDVTPFTRGARWASTSLGAVFDSDKAALGQILEAVTASFTSGEAQSVPATVLSIQDDLQAVSTERGVLAYNYDQDIVQITPSPSKLRLSSEDVYLLVGCLGGLGRSLTTWMMDHGARHFAFISRSGADKPEAAQLVKSIEEAGAFPQVFRGDAANIQDITAAIQTITSTRMIRGVVHAAMVLQDAIFGRKMTMEKFQGAITPKVDGALALHHALKDHELDFFVMTSSISATVGLPGQTNYAAANSFLDNLAWQRNLMGLPATSLALPMILGVGVVAENDSLEGKIARRGMYGADEREMLRGFEAAISQPRPGPNPQYHNSSIVLGLEPARLAATWNAEDGNPDISWAEDGRFSTLHTLVTATSGSSNKTSDGEGDIIEQAASAASKDGIDAATTIIAQCLMAKCANILLMSVEDFEFNSGSIGGYGLDSMIGAELRNWLFKTFKLNIPFQDLLATTLTFKGLSGLVLGAVGVTA